MFKIMFIFTLIFFQIFHGIIAIQIVEVVEPLRTVEPFTLEEYILQAFASKSNNASWLSNNLLGYLKNGDVYTFNVETKEQKLLLPKSVLEKYPGGTPKFSADMKYTYIKYNVNAIFRHSVTASYAIYDRTNDKYFDVAAKASIQNFVWDPVGHSLVYVKDNNIYYLENPEDVKNPVMITKDGVPGVIYNGVPDWVYEEEVLGTGSALWFSPTGKKLAFAQFDDTHVPEYDYLFYGKPNDINNLYPEIRRIRYPKVNTTNPTVKTFVVDLSNPKNLLEIQGIPKRFLPDDYVLFDMIWATDDEVSVLSQNRIQNEGELVRCDLNNNCKQEATYKEEKGWLDSSSPIYNKDGSLRIEILPQPEGDDTYNHIVQTDVNKKTAKRMTSGKFVVTSILGYDETNSVIYFIGSGENVFSQQHVYATHKEGVKCLTCKIQTAAGVCRYASAVFNSDFTYYIRTCQGPGPHLVEIIKTNAEECMIWEDNQELTLRLLNKAIPLARDLRIPVADGFEANVRLLLPFDFDETKKYPAIINVYAGPDSNQISDAYSAGVQNYFVSNRQYIYVYIDGRGSGRDGNNKKFQIYRKMGTVEIEDQIAVTRYLQENLPFIDATRTGIWGWSYGGYATAWTIAKDKTHVFCFGLSVAPVTNWLLYDSIYTERYMGLPRKNDNLEGYTNSDLLLNIEAFRGRQFMLIHGNADDNVHYQQSMLLSRALEQADIAFRQQSYPDENHSLGGVYPHLYHTIDRFFARSFGLPDPPVHPFPISSSKP